jgi:hypothetical protein
MVENVCLILTTEWTMEDGIDGMELTAELTMEWTGGNNG